VKKGILITRSLWYYRRTHSAVAGGVAIAVAVLAGALLVGVSVRESLRQLALERLGNTGTVVSAERPFLEAVATALSTDDRFQATAPILYLQGTAVRESDGRRAYRVNVYGVDDRFWRFHGAEGAAGPADRDSLVSPDLAVELGIRAGEPLLLGLERQDDIPRETLYSKKDETARTLRFTCSGTALRSKAGNFSLQPGQGPVRNVFVSLRRLQRDLNCRGRANVVLVRDTGADPAALRRRLRAAVTLEDFGVGIRRIPSSDVLSIGAGRIVLDDSLVESAAEASAAANLETSGITTWLATSIRAGGREIPYSAVTAADLGKGPFAGVRLIAGRLPSAAGPERDAIWLNEWAWKELGVEPGASVEIEYYVWLEAGRVESRRTSFRLEGVVAIDGVVGPGLSPEYPGIAEAATLNDWDPPFPVDLKQIRPRDEEYWERHRATPKAFIRAAAGRDLWRTRFGSITSILVRPRAGTDTESARVAIGRELLARLDPEKHGFAITPARARAIEASRGSTDFGEYFLYFSFFLIAAAVLLAALFFRLGIEQRLPGIGILAATGFSPGSIRSLFLVEGLAVAAAGSLVGCAAALGYAWLLVSGLGNWWVGAVGTRDISLHVTPFPLIAGALGGFAASTCAITMTLRMVRRNPVRSLLTGILEPEKARKRAHRRAGFYAAGFLAAGLCAMAAGISGAIPQVAGFFVAGFQLVIAAVAATARILRRPRRSSGALRGRGGIVRLGWLGTTFRPGRSVLCVTLIAFALFVVVSMEAFHHEERDISLSPDSGTGGFRLLAESTAPLVHDISAPGGRAELGFVDAFAAAVEDVRFVPFRLRPGDDTSCLNLYVPRQPRILGASPAFVRMNRFGFQSSTAANAAQARNPWELLDVDPGDDAIPAIADANTIQYVLHSSVGSAISVTDELGRPVRLRFVAALRNSIFQGELIVGEANFLRLFPGQQGYRWFLIETEGRDEASLTSVLEERLSPWGFDVQPSRERLASYQRVENTYLSTFQALGALGLILGTAGMATVLLRNVLERRGELALLRAVGFRSSDLTSIILCENLALLALGIACGTGPALLAVAPALLTRGITYPLAGLAAILGGILVTGLLASILAVAAAVRAPLLASLRGE
jgi:putative ABC transport system permease protein